MLDALEAPDRLVDLDALLRVAGGELERGFRGADGFGGDGDGSTIEQAFEQRRGAPGLAEDRIRFDAHAVEPQTALSLGDVDRPRGLDVETGGGAFDHGEGDVLLTGSTLEGNDEQVGIRGVEHHVLPAREEEGIGVAAGQELDARTPEHVAVLEVGERTDQTAVCDSREPARLLSFASRGLNGS